MTEGRIDVGATSDFAEGTMTGTKVNGSEVLIVKQRGEYFALEDRCTHDNGILHDGDLLEGAVKCDRHGQFLRITGPRPN